MGASILPVTIHKGKLYFLFGKERPNDENPGWSDFGGGTDNKETYIQTAIREGGEELTGFLGSDTDIKHLLTRFGTFDVDYKSTGYSVFRVHIFPMEYDDKLPYYYNNNQRFLQKRLDPKIIRDTKIFEKTQIKWICIDDIPKMKKEFRSFYQNIVDLILARKSEIDTFIRKSLKSKPKHVGSKSRSMNKSMNKSRSKKSRKRR
jgi:NUDIX domain